MSLEVIKYDVETGIAKGTQKGMTQMCALITAQAKTLCPVAIKYGGTLKGSIGYKTTEVNTNNLQEKVKLYQGLVGIPIDYATVYYATYVEFGTIKMKAQPYLAPAVDMVKNGTSWQTAVKNALNSEIVLSIAKKRVLKYGG